MREQLNLADDAFLGEAPAYLQSQLIIYIGNKRALLPLIAESVALVKSHW